jgi:uncharacterized protein YcfJ
VIAGAAVGAVAVVGVVGAGLVHFGAFAAVAAAPLAGGFNGRPVIRERLHRLC